jgi:DNA invertase Pin-like site-specific DNA recombinase
MPVYVYCRVSTYGHNSVSLDAQEEAIKQVLDRLHWKVKYIDKEVRSAFGTVSEKIKSYVDKRGYNIVMYAVDRYSRNFKDGVTTAISLLARGHKLYFVREKLEVDSVDSNTWRVFLEYLKRAEQASQEIADRVFTSKSYLKKQGYHTESNTPFGYKKRKLDNGRTVLQEKAYDHKVLKFIEACRTEKTTITAISKALSLLAPSAKQFPLELEEFDYDKNDNPIVSMKHYETKKIGPLTYENIASILNTYEVPVIGKGSWTAHKVAKIYNGNSIDALGKRVRKM